MRAGRPPYDGETIFGISLTLVVLMVATAILDNLFAPRAPETRFDRTLSVYVPVTS